MRRFITYLLLILLVPGVLALGIGYGLAVSGPFLPGDNLYPLQHAAQQARAALLIDPINQARFYLDLAASRAEDLAQRAGTDHELTALSALNAAIEQALAALAALPVEGVASVQGNIAPAVTQGDRAYRLLLTPARDELLEYQRLQNGLAALRAYLSQPPAGDAVISPQTTAVMTPTLTPLLTSSIPTALITPRGVVFPPGSAGAEHAFFPLTGQHNRLECQSCHPAGEYTGTPNLCSVCHAPVLPANHFRDECTLCHTTTAWSPASFDHTRAGSENCTRCHQGDAPANHFIAQCSACHSSTAWTPASFNHAAVDTSNCQGCHRPDRPANHFDGQCSACHSTSAWLPASFNHAVANATDCQGCHGGDRPANHFSGQCSACHSTSAWLPASFNHAAAGATDCQSCHAGNRPANHFSGQCSDCHSTSAWLPANFSHSFPMNHENANGECSRCHPGGGSEWTCYTCHEQAEMVEEHADEDIFDIAGRCLACHPDGREP